MNLSAGTSVAIPEFATAPGSVDYALFVDKRFCGVVEAKPAGTTLNGFSEKAARYIADAPDFLGGGPHQRRLEYVASDTEALFRDLADPEPRSRRVCAFHRPETLRRWLSEPETLRERLRHFSRLTNGTVIPCRVTFLPLHGHEPTHRRERARSYLPRCLSKKRAISVKTSFVSGAYGSKLYWACDMPS